MTLRPSLEKAIESLKKEVIYMADLALDHIKKGLLAFKTNNEDLAKAIIDSDDLVDQLEESIAKKALNIILKEQPVAKDLRLVTGVLKLITDLERIGDHAADIALMTLHLEDKRNQRIMPLTTQMTNIAIDMVKQSIDALCKVSKEDAEQVIQTDDSVDQLFDQIVLKMTNELKHDKIEPNEAIYVLMVAKYIERIADHAVNIAQWVIFMETGEHKHTSLF